MSLLRSLILVLAATSLVACGGMRSRSRGPRLAASEAVLTERDIAQSSARNAYDAVQWLCPPRVRSTLEQRTVYLDGMPLREVSALQGVPSGVIREIRWLDAREAVILYGATHADGVILVFTKPAG